MKKIGYLCWVAFGVFLAAMKASAQTAVTFPTLPDGSAWVNSLTTLFISAAALGLGILGLKFVISMISAGLAKRRGR
jgi:hypothetical protein